MSAERHDDPAAISRNLRAVMSRLRRELRRLATHDELTPSQTSVLARISGDGPFTAAELAAAERVRPQSMAASLNALASHGYVERSPDPDDGRRQILALTEAGHELLEGDRATRQEWLATAINDRFTDEERTTLADAVQLLERLCR